MLLHFELTFDATVNLKHKFDICRLTLINYLYAHFFAIGTFTLVPKHQSARAGWIHRMAINQKKDRQN